MKVQAISFRGNRPAQVSKDVFPLTVSQEIAIDIRLDLGGRRGGTGIPVNSRTRALSLGKIMRQRPHVSNGVQEAVSIFVVIAALHGAIILRALS
jgi:hypothetical protein